MVTHVGNVNALLKVGAPSRPTNVRGFLWHLFQMVLAMEIGMGVYHLVVRMLVAPTVYAELRQAYPLVTYSLMVLFMVLGMLVWMRYKKSTWRYCLEMSLAMVAPIIALCILVVANLLPIQVLRISGDPLMILAMAALMLYRPHEHAHESTDSHEPTHVHEPAGSHGTNN